MSDVPDLGLSPVDVLSSSESKDGNFGILYNCSLLFLELL